MPLLTNKLDFEQLITSKDWRDLLQFVRIEKESGDIEPWADLLKRLTDLQTREESLWITSLYNTYDSLSSAWAVYRRWKHPLTWLSASDREEARNYPCMQERRNLHGGRVNKRLQSYAEQLVRGRPGAQYNWLSSGIRGEDRNNNFQTLMGHVRQVWGVGRQASFEWVEFLGKVSNFPVAAPTAELWESSGPRHSIQNLYRDSEPNMATLDAYAEQCRNWLADNGVELSWEDFETVVCDYKVMQRGRYYPGRHLAALRGEIDEIGPPDRDNLLAIFREIVTGQWRNIKPGINKSLLGVYKATGTIILGV